MSDIHTFLAFCFLLLLLEIFNVFIKFVQGRDVFICDFVVVIKISQVHLFMMYFDPMIGYEHKHLKVFCDVVVNNFSIDTQDCTHVHVRTMKIYVVAMEVLMNKERGDETQFITKIGGNN